MTREEAKKYLIEHCNPDYPSAGRLEWDRAMDVAIKALEQDDMIDRVLKIIEGYKIQGQQNTKSEGFNTMLCVMQREVAALKGEICVD